MDNAVSKFNHLRFKDKKIFLSVCYSNSYSEDEFLNFIAGCLDNGVKILSFYQNDLSACKFIDLAQKIRQLTAFYNSIFFIHSRFDFAQIVEADGIYLENEDIDISFIKPLVNEHFIFAKSSENDDYLILNDDISFTFKLIKNEDEICKFNEFIKPFHGIMLSDKFFNYEKISEALKIFKDNNYAK